MRLYELCATVFKISRSEARRLIVGGGFYINDVRMSDPNLWWPHTSLWVYAV